MAAECQQCLGLASSEFLSLCYLSFVLNQGKGKRGPLSCAKLEFKAMPCPAVWWQEMDDGIDVLEGK